MPDPVGATTRVWCPALIACQAASWAGVGSAKTVSNHARVCGEKADRAVGTYPSCVGRRRQSRTTGRDAGVGACGRLWTRVNGGMELTHVATTAAPGRRPWPHSSSSELSPLTGCFTLDMELELSSDDTVDGSIVLAVDRDQAELFGGRTRCARRWPVRETSSARTRPPARSRPREYEDDDWIGNEYIFTDVALEEFSGADDRRPLDHPRG